MHDTMTTAPTPEAPAPIPSPVDPVERRARRARRIRASKSSVAVLATANRITGSVREHLIRSGWHPDGWVVVVTPEQETSEQPEWYVNIRAGAKAVVVDGNERHVVRARETRGRERLKLWNQMTRLDPRLGDHFSARQPSPPVLVLERIGVFATR